MSKSSGQGGFTLVELLVVIAIIGTLMGLLLPAVQNARESSRSNACRSNLTNLQRAMTSYEVANKEFPGYVNPVGIASGVKASWGAMLLPFIEQQQLWDKFVAGKPGAAAAIQIYVCPSNPPQYEGGPAMSYLANAGWFQQEKIDDENDDCSPKENPADGLFFDKTRSATDVGPPDVRDLKPDCHQEESDPVVKMTFATVQAKGDGSTNTLMFAEGINAGVWTGISTPDKKWHYGFCWEQPDIVAQALSNGVSSPQLVSDAQYRLVDGVREILPEYKGDKAPNTGIASSFHSAGVNVAFVGGQVLFISDRINPLVWAQLMTTNYKLSDLKLHGKYDRDLPQPDADDY